MLQPPFFVAADGRFRGDAILTTFGTNFFIVELTFSSATTLRFSTCDHLAHDDESVIDALSTGLIFVAVEDFVDIIATCCDGAVAVVDTVLFNPGRTSRNPLNLRFGFSVCEPST